MTMKKLIAGLVAGAFIGGGVAATTAASASPSGPPIFGQDKFHANAVYVAACGDTSEGGVFYFRTAFGAGKKFARELARHARSHDLAAVTWTDGHGKSVAQRRWDCG